MIPRRIIVHCSATKDSGTVSWGAIRAYHKERLGWIDIGYHFGIEDVNNHLEILIGRMPDEIGAHCRNRNLGSLGICVVGDYDKDILTLNHEKLLAKLVHWLILNYRIPFTEIYGHRDFDSHKSCPGENLYRFLKNLKEGR